MGQGGELRDGRLIDRLHQVLQLALLLLDVLVRVRVRVRVRVGV